MRFEQLKYLVMVQKTKSMTSAETLLFTSHQNISKSLSALENELGITLLNRTRRGVSLTPEGAEIAKYAEEILGLQNKIIACSTSTSHKESHKEEINVLMNRGVAQKILLASTSFEDYYSDVEIYSKVVDQSNFARKDIEDYHIVFRICEDDRSWSQETAELQELYNVYTWFTDQIVLVASSKMEMDTSKLLNKHEIEVLPAIFARDVLAEENYTLSILKKYGYNFKHYRQPGTTEISSMFVKEGKGVTFGLSKLADDTIAGHDNQLQKYYFEAPIHMKIEVLVRKNASERAKEFAQFVLNAYKL